MFLDTNFFILLIVLILALGQFLLTAVLIEQLHHQPPPATNKDLELLNSAQKKAQAIISEAQLAALKLTAENSEALKHSNVQIKAAFEKTVADNLQKSLTQFNLRLTNVFDQSEKTLADFRQKRMAAFETSLTPVLEKIAIDVFGKKLELKDHAEIILEALEKAKADKFLT